MYLYKRLFQYCLRYKTRLFLGIVLSFFVSVFNGASLTSLIPIFDSLGEGENYKFQISLTKRDSELLKLKESPTELKNIEKIELFLTEKKILLNQKFSSMQPDELVFLFCMIVFPIYLLKLLCLGGTVYFINSCGLLAVKDIRNELYSKLQFLPMNYFIQEKTGILMSRIINDVEAVGKIISSDMKDAINDLFFIITHLLILFYLSWKMFLVVFIVIPLIFGPVSAFTDKIRKATKSQQDRLSALNGDLQEVISGIRVIRAFNMEEKESQRFSKVSQELADKTFIGHFFHQVGPSLIELTGSMVGVLFLSFGALLMEDPEFSRGMFLAFFMTLIFLMRPIKQLSILFNLTQSAISAGDRVFQLLDEESDLVRTPNPILPGKLKYSLLFQNVTYQYPGTETKALDGINLAIPAKQTVAIVGPSGSGKSTLTDLIPRLMDPTEGKILLDGMNLRYLDLAELRKKIAIVSQNVFLFNGTILENIAYGSKNPTKEEVRKAAEDAYATEFIDAFEDGFQTQVGERGVMLSGGQKQRLSIARALLRDPEILVLDEATSALDTESERLIQDALQKLSQNRTVILIAHRLTTVTNAQCIYFMEKGKVIESGTHTDLMSTDTQYKKLYNLQFQEA